MSHTAAMDTLVSTSSIGELLALVGMPIAIVATLVALTLATGLAGRIVLYFEELPHRTTPRSVAPPLERTH